MSFRTIGIFALALAALGGPALSPLADTITDARKAIQAQYEHSNAAMLKKDLKGFISIYAPGYSRLDTKGRTNPLKVVKQRMALVFSQTVSARGSSAITGFKLNNDTAIVRVKESRMFAYSSPQTGSVSKMLVECVNEDTWVKSGATWLDSGTRIVSEKDTIDGKPAPVQ